MTPENEIGRRDFLERAGKLAAGLGAGAAALNAAGCALPPRKYEQASSLAPRAPGEKIRMGFIGVGGRGRTILKTFMETGDVEVAYLCDVNQLALGEAVKIAGEQTPRSEYHERVLERTDIDAVAIATPDHWHAILTIEACKAGKDVYVEKPLSLCVAEGRRMIQAARKHGRIVQLGTQQVSGPHYQEAKARIRKNELGRITMVRVWNFRNSYPGRGKQSDEASPPPTIYWDRWLGPRPYRPYNPLRASGGFRFFWDYAGGVLTDWGVHHFHTILDIMGYPDPLRVTAAGGRYAIDDITEVPDTLSVLYEFPGWTLEYSNREANGMPPYGSEYGIEFCGVDATMFLDRKGFIIHREKDRSKPEITGTPGKDNFVPPELDVPHVRNFLRCVRDRKLPASDVELGHKATNLAHLGNIAYHVKRTIEWDAANETIPGDWAASGLLRRSYRKPYGLPRA